MPYVQLLADFRDDIRSIAREEKGKPNVSIYPLILDLFSSESRGESAARVILAKNI